jgi:hypothetical protein
MKNITDEDLTLLYYGEQDDPRLAIKVAESEELSARFDALCTELQRVDALVPPERDVDYGAEVWKQISPRLSEPNNKSASRWAGLLSAFKRPRLSLAGAFSIAMIASLAFFLGRQGGQPGESIQLDPYTNPAFVLTNQETERLLTRSVSGHLEQVNIVFTQFANTPESSASEAERATDMLVANRLLRRTAISKGDQ